MVGRIKYKRLTSLLIFVIFLVAACTTGDEDLPMEANNPTEIPIQGNILVDISQEFQTFEVELGVYDWNRDANAVWVLKAAQEIGVERFAAFANSPPARMTVAGRTNGEVERLSNLAPEMYAEFADYLVDVVRHLQEDEGIPIEWLSPINEP